MRAGRLDRIITVERLIAGEPDQDGVPSSTPDLYAERNMPAEVITAAADEFLTGSGTASMETIVFRIRYRDDVLASDRVRYAGRTYGIVGIVEIGRRAGLEIRATSKAPDA